MINDLPNQFKKARAPAPLVPAPKASTGRRVAQRPPGLRTRAREIAREAVARRRLRAKTTIDEPRPDADLPVPSGPPVQHQPP